MLVLLISSASPDLTQAAATLALDHLAGGKLTEGSADGLRARVEGATSDPAAVLGALGDAWGDSLSIVHTFAPSAPTAPEPVAEPVMGAPAESGAVEPGAAEPVTPVGVPFVFKAHAGSPRERVALGTEFCQSASGLVTFSEPPTAWDGDVWTVRGHTTDSARLAASPALGDAAGLYLDGKLIAGKAVPKKPKPA